MARLLSTSPAIPQPKTANVYIPVITPQLQVTNYLRQTAPRDLGEDVLPGGSLRITEDGEIEVVAPGQQGLGGPPEPTP